MTIAGIDYSTTSPSICIYDTETDDLSFHALCTVKKYAGEYLTESAAIYINHIEINPVKEIQFLNICNWAKKVLIYHDVESVVLEGYAFGATGQVFQIAENTSLLKQAMHLMRIPFTSLAPTNIKKQYTGAGNASKDAIIEQVQRELGFNFQEILGTPKPNSTPISDMCDSYAIVRQHEFFKKTV